ncbi:transporter [Oceanobacillus oncorhynchi subsp. incaldanensis]|uniref:EamA-like transporter family protein n=2 Tax=Oceanobacillus oncorhynchi TaxID=545501 RepID=A0A0A1MC82_9BACI|nr:EamA family transporter RarD [Oceanobacillus oncorhynchi]UUI39687.1 EamA family transporter RarD [Oceanobacillus oncorhynchi]GIO19088.1 transporter [Oceanobacillus oncorhynchi subsp. incaldanensis]CEI80678.1 EamA-like transporter family protein [Oceanobacillus oncorhynchi]
MEDKSLQQGAVITFAAYLLWGIFPIYWKFLEHVPAGEVLAHRIVWSLIFMIFLVLVTGNWRELIETVHELKKDKKKTIAIITASIVISINWFLFIFSVQHGHVLQASLGYYINPLISILLAVFVLKEKTTKGQVLSFILAGIGVLYLTLSYGVFPWISLLLAITFGFYGLIKKTLHLHAMYGLTIETLVVAPIALLYLLFVPSEGSFTFSPLFTSDNLLLIGAGGVTAIPLLLFAAGAKRIPLAMVGFLQYVAPTIMFFLGVFLYNETFTVHHMITFALIWAALIIYMASIYRDAPRRKRRKA